MEGSSQLRSSNTSKTMAEALATSSSSSNNNRSREMENLSLEISKYPRDLLQKLLPTNQSTRRLDDLKIGVLGGGDVEEEDDDGLNLGLGLSLGGKFGVDKSHKLGLVRSSSIAGTMPLVREVDRVAPPPPAAVHTLARTASLPVETEEEWRKRKEMQTLRRMEAKRRRSEKQRVLKEGGGGGGDEKGVESLNFRGRLKREQQCLGMNSTNKLVSSSSVGNSFGSSSSPPKVEAKGRRTTFGSLQGFLMAQSQAQAQAQAQASHGSGESQGGNSSGASELESKTHQGSSSCGDARSPGSSHSQQDRGSQDSGSKGETTQRGLGLDLESSPKQPEGGDNKRQEGGMEDMPCVFTIGCGPNGIRKVEGILYRYGKGEEVRIMCVCHGSFFSPADFVRHAGGRDVEHPLRHIVVSPSPSPFQ